MYFTAFFTYNPFGIERNFTVFSYKHALPSGMLATLNVRYKADNSDKKSRFYLKVK
jgi:hypothetical protein